MSGVVHESSPRRRLSDRAPRRENGACPLTVEKGKVVLAEFGWGGQLMPSFPGWLIKNTAPSRLAWAFKRHALPWFYWHIMLPGRSWCDPMSWPSVREKGER